MTEFLRLDSPACTALWECPPGEAPLWRYWGPRLPDGAMPRHALRDTRPEPSFSLHFDQPLSVFPGAGVGWFGAPALLAHRNGQDWTFAPTTTCVERPDPNSVVFILSDDVARIEVQLTARLDPATDTLTLATTLTNGGDAVLDVQWLAAGTLPLPPDARLVRSYGGRHNSEFVPIDSLLTRSTWRQDNRRGLTSHNNFPGAIVTCADGTVYGAQLGWSGNHVQQIEWGEDGRFHWHMGEGFAPGEVRLAAGECITTPDMLATCSDDGVNGVTWAFHRAIRARMTWPKGNMTPRPVHLNTWEGFYFHHELEALKALATSAAEAGVERFVLDDGWFQGRDDDTSSLGDWRVDARKYPDGLAPLANHVVGLGMEFGLWVEPEMVNPDSDLFRAHPDWVLQVNGRPLLAARNQLVLDLARPDVSGYLFAAISDVLRGLPVSYIKWDHNRDLTHAGNTPRYRQQVLAAYALFDRFRSAFPHIEIEACAGGGGRIDAGIVRHTHRFWTSDCIDAVSRVGIQRGFLTFMPPELMGSHVGACPAHSTGRMQSMAFRSGVALPGHFGVELDLRAVVGEERDALKTAIARYKALRGRLHGVRVWMGDAADNMCWQAHGAPDNLLLFITRTQPTTQRHQPHVRLPMVSAGRPYRAVRAGAPDLTLDGAWLQRVGLPVPPMDGEDVLLFELIAQ